jgi:hypothetical protein
MVPESVSLYELEVSQEEFDKLGRCHGYYANTTTAPEEVTWLGEWLYNTKPSEVEVLPGNPPFIPATKYDAVVVTGFLL